jgi:iron complex outermembrane receptor protein
VRYRLRWRPASRSVAARCAAAIGPTASTFRQLRQGYVPASGPDEQTPDPFNAVSNPNLTPEKSKSKTVGLVWSPTFAQGLNMSLDWWNIKITNTIVTDSPDDQLNDCYVLASPSAATRSPVIRTVTT